MILLNPEGSSDERLSSMAVRPGTLNGRTIGLLSNSKLNADAVLYAVGELLTKRYDVKAVIHRTKPSFSVPAPEATVKELVENCDVVLAGVGD